MSTYEFDQLDQHGRSIIQSIHDRAATDQDFRELALSDPRAAVLEVSEEPLPEDFRLRFFDSKEYDFASILPDPESDGELTDDELDAVAGGSGSGGTYDGGGD